MLLFNASMYSCDPVLFLASLINDGISASTFSQIARSTSISLLIGLGFSSVLAAGATACVHGEPTVTVTVCCGLTFTFWCVSGSARSPDGCEFRRFPQKSPPTKIDTPSAAGIQRGLHPVGQICTKKSWTPIFSKNSVNKASREPPPIATMKPISADQITW
jgi:hypothetical protein